MTLWNLVKWRKFLISYFRHCSVLGYYRDRKQMSQCFIQRLLVFCIFSYVCVFQNQRLIIITWKPEHDGFVIATQWRFISDCMYNITHANSHVILTTYDSMRVKLTKFLIDYLQFCKDWETITFFFYMDNKQVNWFVFYARTATCMASGYIRLSLWYTILRHKTRLHENQHNDNLSTP